MNTGMRRVARICTVMVLATPSAIISEPIGGFSESFANLSPQVWHVANYRFTHPAFDTDWTPDNLHLDDGLHLQLTPQHPQKPSHNRFLGASVRHTKETHYGRYEATLRPARGDGLVTGFFTYTGPHYGSRHDEIDIEFLGEDTTKLQVAWFVDGVLQSRVISLGFDAADHSKSYAFEWHPDRIRWFAEDRLIFEITDDQSPLPKMPGYLFANLWAVDQSLSTWAGHAPDNTTAQALVSHIRFTPLQALTASAAPIVTPRSTPVSAL